MEPRTAERDLFFFNDTATTEIYTLSLHDALPISPANLGITNIGQISIIVHDLERATGFYRDALGLQIGRAHSELQSRLHLVCRLLLEKKKKKITYHILQITLESLFREL